MPGLLKRVAAKRKQPPPSPAKLERLRRQRWGDDLYERLCGESNAFDGAQQVIANAKANGTWFDPDAKKAERQRFKLNRKQTKRRIAQLERRVNGHDVEANGSSATTARSPSATKPSITQPERNQAMTTQTQIANAGYKGHRIGTMKEKAHRLTDEMLAKKAERPAILARIVKLGAADNTAASWYSNFKATFAQPKKVAITKKKVGKK